MRSNPIRRWMTLSVLVTCALVSVARARADAGPDGGDDADGAGGGGPDVGGTVLEGGGASCALAAAGKGRVPAVGGVAAEVVNAAVARKRRGGEAGGEARAGAARGGEGRGRLSRGGAG